MKSKKILVTGGAGYIGSHVVAALGEAGYNITIIDNLSTGKKESVLFGNLIIEDLINIDAIEQVIKSGDFDAIFHFAGSIVVPESIENPLKYYINNTLNSCNLINLCCKHGINKFIFSSTAATYGMPENGIATEDTEQKPINPYGHSKLMTEKMLQDVSYSNPDFKFVALRYFNVSGADSKGRIGQCFPGATHLIKVCCEAATGKRKGIQIFGTDYPTPDGTCVRDYIHVEDLAQAHLSVYDYLTQGAMSDFFNCGYGHGYSVREVIEAVKKISNVAFYVEEVQPRDGDSSMLVSDSSKIKALTNWNPKLDDLNYIIKTAHDWELKLQ